MHSVQTEKSACRNVGEEEAALSPLVQIASKKIKRRAAMWGKAAGQMIRLPQSLQNPSAVGQSLPQLEQPDITKVTLN